MRAALLLLLLLCVLEAEADDIRWEVDARFKHINTSLEERLSSMEAGEGAVSLVEAVSNSNN